MDSNLFVSKYELYLPNRKELEKLVKDILDDEENQEQIQIVCFNDKVLIEYLGELSDLNSTTFEGII